MLYKLSLFIHVSAVIVLCGAMAVEWLHVINFRRTDDFETVLKSVTGYSKLNMIGSIALLLILVPGLYMMIAVWNGVAWASAGFVGFILMGAFSGSITSRKIKNIKKTLASENMMGPKLKSSLADKSLLFSIQIRTTLLFGIIYLMTVKPGLTGTIVALVISLALGFVPLNIKSA
jgi:hypothetical protein